MTMTPDELYSAIKAQELNFPLPTPSTTVSVGRFNAASGTFSGLVSKATYTTESGGAEGPPRPPSIVGAGGDPSISPELPAGGGPGKPIKIMVPPEVSVNAVNVTLTFTSTAPNITLVVNGQTYTSTTGSIAVPIGDAGTVSWRISANGKSYADTLILDRPPIIGVGAFIIPALPVCLVYEPPTDASKKNVASYSTSTTLTTSMKMAFTNDQSHSDDGDFLTLAGAASLLKSLADLAKTLKGDGGGKGSTGSGGSSSTGGSIAKPIAMFDPVTVGAAIAGALSLLASAVGSTTDTTASDASVTDTNTLTLKTTQAQLSTTGGPAGNAGGPGVGDFFRVIRNAKLMWIALNGKVSLTLLGYQSTSHVTVSDLKNPAAVGLDAATAQTLLALDPFVAGGPAVMPPSARFTSMGILEMDSAGIENQSLAITIDADAQHAEVNSETTVEQAREGWLGFLGIGPSSNSTTKTVVTNTVTTDTDTSTTVTATATFNFTPNNNDGKPFDKPYAVEMFTDAVFGSFAFRQALLATEPTVIGTVGGPQGPLANVAVTVKSGTRTWHTRTDAKGNFQFRSTIPAGPISVSAPGANVSATIAANGKAGPIQLRAAK